jgi:UDP-glucose 4-epimerase
VRDIFSCEKALGANDCVIHLASVNETISNSDIILAHNVNTLGTLNMIKASEVSGCSKFIYFSTSQVYGPMNGKIITENSSTFPVNEYGRSHLDAENYVRNSSIDFSIIRLANAIGNTPNWDSINWNNVTNDLCRQVVMTDQMVMKTSGLQHRSFVAITDVAEYIHDLVANRPLEAKRKIQNYGSEKSISIREFAQLIENEARLLFGKSPRLSFGELETSVDQRAFQFICSNIKTPAYPLSKEIAELLLRFESEKETKIF